MVPLIKSPFGIKGTTWNKDGTTFAYVEGNNIIVRNSEEYTPLQTIITQNGNILFMQFTQSTSGEGLNQIATLTDRNILDIRILPYEEPINTVFLDSTQKPSALAYSYNGNYIATGTEDGFVTLFFQNYITNTMTSRNLGKMTGTVHSISFSRDNRFLLASDTNDNIMIWNVISGELVKECTFFSQNGVPALPSHDAQFIVAATGPTTLGIYNFDYEFLKEIETEKPILSIDFTADGTELIILTEDNCFTFYDFDTFQPAFYIPQYNANPVSSYSFNNTTTKLLVGHSDGSIYVLNIDDVKLAPGEVPPTYFMIAADDPEALKKLLGIEDETIQVTENPDEQVNMVRHKNEDAVEVSVGIKSIDYPFICGVEVEGAYKNYLLIPPFYFGGGINHQVGFPSKNFPNEYFTPGIGELKKPLFLGTTVFAPLGLFVYPFANNIPVFVELDNGVSILSYWNQIIGPGGLLLPPKVAYSLSLRVGCEYKNFKAIIQANFDTISKFSLGFAVGFNINLPIIEPKEKTLNEKTESTD